MLRSYTLSMGHIYQKGQVVLPKRVREAAGVEVGDEVIVEARGAEIVVRKAPSIFNHVPIRPRRADVDLTERATTEAAWEDHIAAKFAPATHR